MSCIKRPICIGCKRFATLTLCLRFMFRLFWGCPSGFSCTWSECSLYVFKVMLWFLTPVTAVPLRPMFRRSDDSVRRFAVILTSLLWVVQSVPLLSFFYDFYLLSLFGRDLYLSAQRVSLSILEMMAYSTSCNRLGWGLCPDVGQVTLCTRICCYVSACFASRMLLDWSEDMNRPSSLANTIRELFRGNK